MNIYLLFGILLILTIGTFYIVENKISSVFRPIPIVTHLLSCCTIIPLTLYLYSFFDYPLPTISNSSFLVSLNQSLGAIVLCLILQELSSVRPQMRMLKLAGLSSLIPVISAIIFAFIFGFLSNITLTFSFIFLFSLSAIPVLYIYLKQSGANQDTINLFMGAAIAIDTLGWIGFSILSTQFNLLVFIISITLGFLPLLIKKFVNNHNLNIWSLVLSISFFLIFTTLYFNHGYALLFAILFIYNMQKFTNMKSAIPEKWLFNFFNYAAIPMLFILASLSISWSEINLSNSWIMILCLILLPIISKVISSYLALNAIQYKGDKKIGSLLLNSRGLTEIVFINTLFIMKIITPEMFIGLILMTLIATIIPGIYIKTKMFKTQKKILNIYRFK